jgi:serine/threonine protein kinase
MSELRLQHCRLDGGYDILECLGRGSYAEIYKAHDNAAPEGVADTVVIKARNLRLQDEPDPDLERTLVVNFQNEAVALDRVRHPKIISRLGHGTAIDLDGTTFHYIVLEYLPGGDLAALSRHRPLPIDLALSYLEQVCSGLAHAHECGVIHRDIKPQNLLLTADKQIVKIADFGVARLETTEGAITRVGTSIYSAPEHNPLAAQLDTAALSLCGLHLTPAADIYSLAKTSYTLLAGEAPRRFAQQAITELPEFLNDRPWATSVLRVLERATQTRAEDRYQSVQEFWVELADAGLPETQELPRLGVEPSKRPSADLQIEPQEITEAPPRPHFEVPRLSEPAYAGFPSMQRPRIVVPVSQAHMAQNNFAEFAQRRTASQIIAAFPDQAARSSPARQRAGTLKQRGGASARKRFLVAVLLISAFAGMLLATHRYVTSHWNPLADIPALTNTFTVGREGVTTTDVNLRPNPSAENPPVGLAENGSRVRVLGVNNNWYEVQVLQHGRPKADQYTSDRGWMNKKYLKFD